MENPDNAYVIGLGPQSKIVTDDGDELDMDMRHLIPTQGTLRFVEKEIDNHGTPAKARVLQQYQWCAEKGAFDWYDIPLVTTE